MTRVVVMALLLVLVGCSGATSPADDQPSVDETFADEVRAMVGEMSDEEAIDEAKGACFELVRMVERPRDLSLFIRLFAAVVAPEHVIPFLVVSMQTYCPEMERFRSPTPA